MSMKQNLKNKEHDTQVKLHLHQRTYPVSTESTPSTQVSGMKPFWVSIVEHKYIVLR